MPPEKVECIRDPLYGCEGIAFVKTGNERSEMRIAPTEFITEGDKTEQGSSLSHLEKDQLRPCRVGAISDYPNKVSGDGGSGLRMRFDVVRFAARSIFVTEHMCWKLPDSQSFQAGLSKLVSRRADYREIERLRERLRMIESGWDCPESLESGIVAEQNGHVILRIGIVLGIVGMAVVEQLVCLGEWFFRTVSYLTGI